MATLPASFFEFKRGACPVCGHRGRCKNSGEHPNDLILCFRISADCVNGYRRIKTTRECTTFVRIGSPADRGESATRKPHGKSDLDGLAARFTAAMPADELERLACELGVDVDSLRALGIGWDGQNPVFPERDATARVTAINTRYSNGTKRVGPGQSRGLYIPDGLTALPAPVLIVEGASDAAACLTMGLAAVGRPNNNGGARHMIELLSGRDVLVVRENDEKPDGSWPGRDGARRVAEQLAAAWKQSVRHSMPPVGVKDVRAYLLANRDRDPAEVGRELLAHLGANAIATDASVGSVGSLPEEPSESWPDPQPLPDELPPVAPFSLELLPNAFRGWVQDIVARSQCPPDFPAVGAMVSLAALVGRKVGIRPKRRDNWTVVPNLWGATIGRSGLLKTPMLEETTRPLKRIEIEAKGRYAEEVRKQNAKLMVAGARRKEGERQVRDALRSGADAESVAMAALASNDESRTPVRRRILVNDCTVEKLGEILNENPNGVMEYRDELIGLLRSFERDGHESARAFYLEAWNGTGRFTYDRIERGTIDIESTTVSILGGIQPTVLLQYLRSSFQTNGDDGFIQRFQLAVWPDVSEDWCNVDEWPDTAAKNRAYAVFQRMDALDPATIGSELDDDADGIPFLRFDDEAQALFNEWRHVLEHRLRSGELHPVLESHLAKYRSLIPSLALLIHLADDGTGSVGSVSLGKAIAWGEYLETHARRIYHVAVNPDLAAALALAKKITQGDLSDGFALRDIYRRGWTGLSDRDDVKRAAELLCDLDWLSSRREETAGAPRTRFWINPKIHGLPGQPPDKTDKTPKGHLPSVLSPPSPGTLAESGARVEYPTPDDSDRLEHEAIVEVEAETEAKDREPKEDEDDGEATT